MTSSNRQSDQAVEGCQPLKSQLGQPTAPVPTFNLEILQLDPDDPSDSQWEAHDDVHGGALPPELVRAARRKEIQFLKDRKVYSVSTAAEAFRLTRRPPLELKWIDTNKVDQRLFNIRSRLECTEIRRKGIEAIFSATPPLEFLRALIAKAASQVPLNKQDPYKIMLVDVSCAHFYANSVRDVFIQLPSEDPHSATPGACGKLEKIMYRSLDAAEQWANHYAATLTKAGFVRGTASPCDFYHAARDFWMLVHGDDFVTVARADGRAYVEQTLRSQYEINVDFPWPEAHDSKELKVLGRIITY